MHVVALVFGLPLLLLFGGLILSWDNPKIAVHGYIAVSIAIICAAAFSDPGGFSMAVTLFVLAADFFYALPCLKAFGVDHSLRLVIAFVNLVMPGGGLVLIFLLGYFIDADIFPAYIQSFLLFYGPLICFVIALLLLKFADY